MKYDYCIIGAGLYGAVMAERLIDFGRSVLVVEKRYHIGGNCYSFDFEGINVHKYGPHIFHTETPSTWDYINKFSKFTRIRHTVKTTVDNYVYEFPINLKTINDFYGVNLKPSEVDSFLYDERTIKGLPSNFEDAAISQIGRGLYNAFIRGYTIKQWKTDPKNLPADVFHRLPFRTNYNDSYFYDLYQGVPVDGYLPLFERMFNGADIELGAEADIEYLKTKAHNIIYTGTIDSYFNYCYGILNWRSVTFNHEYRAVDDWQGIGVMHYPGLDVPYTRITEPKHFQLNNKSDHTILTYEYPAEGISDPSHPVRYVEDIEKLMKYSKLAKDESGVIFGGRLAEYKYYDMDEVIEKALGDFNEKIYNKQ